jgi:peptidoglycan/LPS O-acetylase OafA/YrhL
LFVVSLLCGFKVMPCRTGLFLTHWYMFFLGSLLWWTIEGRLRGGIFWIAIAALVAMLAWRGIDAGAVVALLTAVGIWIAAFAGKLRTGLAARPIQYLGRLSHSLYLVHPLIGIRIRGILRKGFGEEFSPLEHFVFFVVSVAACVIAAHVLYVLAERPAMLLARRLKPTARPKPVAAPAES